MYFARVCKSKQHHVEVLLKGFDARISNRELNDASKVSFHLLTKQDVLQDLNLARKLMTNFLHTCIAIIIWKSL